MTGSVLITEDISLLLTFERCSCGGWWRGGSGCGAVRCRSATSPVDSVCILKRTFTPHVTASLLRACTDASVTAGLTLTQYITDWKKAHHKVCLHQRGWKKTWNSPHKVGECSVWKWLRQGQQILRPFGEDPQHHWQDHWVLYVCFLLFSIIHLKF